ncbi:hypothetical protein SSX86_025954 [Deinandra increscens subsp. villosa]|uniref:Uncharacterized protein n=1 Tax=Deinandra increscens subsp. villosa TaxID=3103831 RepID=A0AAP0CIY4_9ASTR
MGTKGRMEDVEVVLKRFGDEQSTLLDRFERLSFEVQLNQAINLGRSLSEPHGVRYAAPPLPLPPPQAEPSQGRRHHCHHRGLGFQKLLKKLFKPIFGRRKMERTENVCDQKHNFKFVKAFSKSLRV